MNLIITLLHGIRYPTTPKGDKTATSCERIGDEKAAAQPQSHCLSKPPYKCEAPRVWAYLSESKTGRLSLGFRVY